MSQKELKIIDERMVLGKQFRIYGDFENPLFLAKDVSEWIEHSDVSMMVKNIDNEDKLIQTMFVSAQKREVLMLTEDGLYEVLMQSRKPIAKKFKKQVKLILKEIRKTGSYIAPNKQSEMFAVEKVINKIQEPEALDLISALANQQKVLLIENKKLNETIQLQQPKVDFCDHVEAASNSMSVGDLAKLLSKQGIKIGRNLLMDWMRSEKYLIKQKGRDYNKPRQEMITQGYMEVKIVTGVNSYTGKEYINNTPLITGKGSIYFIKKYKEYLENKKKLLVSA